MLTTHRRRRTPKTDGSFFSFRASRFHAPRLAGFFAALVCLLFAACRVPQTPEAELKPWPQRVSWLGHFADAYSVDSNDDSSADASAFTPRRAHHFRFASDSLQLDLEEFAHAYQAFARFQAQADEQSMADGYFRSGDKLVFLTGRFLGSLRAKTALVPTRFLAERLVIEDGAEPSGKPSAPHQLPEEFGAFPLLGKIENSERIYDRDFLGRAWTGPVFSVQYRCGSDTATAFRAFAQNESVKAWSKDWSGKQDTLGGLLPGQKEFRFDGTDEFRRPLIFWFFSSGVMGLEGCWDPVMAAEYAEKMEKTQVLWPKP